jgi:hypothetical protein
MGRAIRTPALCVPAPYLLVFAIPTLIGAGVVPHAGEFGGLAPLVDESVVDLNFDSYARFFTDSVVAGLLKSFACAPDHTLCLALAIRWPRFARARSVPTTCCSCSHPAVLEQLPDPHYAWI